jgi:hypothetical protein
MNIVPRVEFLTFEDLYAVIHPGMHTDMHRKCG